MENKVLLVEDEQYIRELYELILNQEGYHVITAADGETGANLAIQEKPNLILLDIMLPKKNGVDILRDVVSNSETSHIPVIMLTNLGQESVMMECLRLGAKEYIIKLQIDPYSLLNVVKKYIPSPKEAEQNSPAM
ncbi:response regulator [candidate division WWE3 bacterium]|nr:response regulator [candidate division WWE3 bacterium]